MTEVIVLGGGWTGVLAALEFKARKPAIEKLARLTEEVLSQKGDLRLN